MKIEIYQDQADEWRWRLKARNGRTIADGAEGYASKRNVLRALRVVRVPVAWVAFPVVEVGQ